MQSGNARRRAGRREVHVWLLEEDAQRLERLAERFGELSARDTIARALYLAEKWSLLDENKPEG